MVLEFCLGSKDTQIGIRNICFTFSAKQSNYFHIYGLKQINMLICIADSFNEMEWANYNNSNSKNLEALWIHLFWHCYKTYSFKVIKYALQLCLVTEETRTSWIMHILTICMKSFISMVIRTAWYILGVSNDVYLKCRFL